MGIQEAVLADCAKAAARRPPNDPAVAQPLQRWPSGTEQMLVPVDAGINRIQITFIRTWDRAAGGWISLLTILALLLWAALERKRRNAIPARP